MSNTLPVTYTHKNSTIPLGTAGWMNFEGDKKPGYSWGDLWLGRTPSGEPVGYNDDRHVLVVSGTRSGKGISVIVPNLCLWPGSAVVIDPKGENAILTARRRGKGSRWAEALFQDVHILDPFGEVRTEHDDFASMQASYNPLDILMSGGKHAVDDAARIADALITSEGTGEPFFDDSAKSVLKALLLHVASSPNFKDDKRNLLTLRHILLAGDSEMRRLMEMNGEGEIPSGISLLFKAMQRNPAYDGVVASSGAMLDELLESSPRTLMSVLQVARTNTDFLDSMAIKDSLKRSTFNLSDLKNGKTTLYLCLPQRYMASHYRWLRMMTTLILGEMERTRPAPDAKYPVLMVLDEFPALGRMKVIENAAAQIAGYGVKLMFVAQTLAQLKGIYKENWETLVANAGLKLFFGNDDHFTREYVSKLIGELELSRWAKTYSSTSGTSKSSSSGWNTSESGNISSSSSSSFGISGGNTNWSQSTSSSSSSGWSQGQSYNTTSGTSESRTRGENESFHKRPLITPDEIGRIFGNRAQPAMLALASGMQPLALMRSPYFIDQSFTGTFDPHPDHKAPLALEVRRKKENDERRNALRIAEYKRLCAVYAAKEAREREALLAQQAAQLAFQKACEEEERARQALEALAIEKTRRLKALMRLLIQLGFVTVSVLFVMRYPPATEFAHQIGREFEALWRMLFKRWF